MVCCTGKCVQYNSRSSAEELARILAGIEPEVEHQGVAALVSGWLSGLFAREPVGFKVEVQVIANSCVLPPRAVRRLGSLIESLVLRAIAPQCMAAQWLTLWRLREHGVRHNNVED